MTPTERAGLLDTLSDLESRAREIRALLGNAHEPSLAISRPLRTYSSFAEALLKGRARISCHLPGKLFADPALEILLRLFVATERGERWTIDEAVRTAKLSYPTMRRWLKALATETLLALEDSEADTAEITMRPTGHAAFSAWLADVSPSSLRHEGPA